MTRRVGSTSSRLFVAGAALLAALTVRCGNGSPTRPGATCTPSLSAGSAAFGADGGTGSVALTTQAGCEWTASAAGPWVSITGAASGSGPATIAYTVGLNSATASRQTTLTIAGLVHAIAQQGRPVTDCTFQLAPPSVRLGKDSGTGTFEVRAPAGCEWAARSLSGWLSITAGAEGSGDGTVSWAAARNTDAADREGRIDVAGQSFVVAQTGDLGICQYTVAPVTASVCMPAGTLSVALTAPASCPWTAASSDGWLTLRTADSGTGSATIVADYTSNYDAPRNATIFVRWPTATAGQNVHLAQAGCRYAVTQSAFSFAASGGSASFDVLQQSDPNECGGALQDRCVWTAVASAPWIQLANTGPRSGDQRVSFTVAVNESTSPRSGTITVRDQTVTVNQAGR